MPALDGYATFAEYVAGLVDSGKAAELREVAGHSYETVGRRLRVAASTVYRWERGLRRPIGRNLGDYANYLNSIQGRRLDPTVAITGCASGAVFGALVKLGCPGDDAARYAHAAMKAIQPIVSEAWRTEAQAAIDDAVGRIRFDDHA